jgi:hypothetical protein
VQLHVHSSSFTVFENPSIYAARQQPSRRQSSVANLDALDCCWAGFTIKRHPSSVIVHHQKKQTRCLQRRCRLNRPPPQPHLVLVVTDHDNVVTRNRTLLTAADFSSSSSSSSSAARARFRTLRLQFESVFSVSLVVLLPVCFIFHRVQFHVRATLPFSSVDGIAVARMVHASERDEPLSPPLTN